MDLHPFFSSSPLTNIRRDASHAFLFLSFFTILVLSYSFIFPFKSPYFLNIGLFPQLFPNNQITETKACDYSNGDWVFDESYALEKYTEQCQFLDPGFRCQQSGRQDLGYRKWRWQPRECDLPRFNATALLERIKNQRLVFAGDSIARNQWESLLCMLEQGVSNKSSIYEENGSPITKHKGFLSFRFQEYNLTVEYYRMPFLVVVDRPPRNTSKEVSRALRVDKLHRYSRKWVGADIFVFGAGHWWSKDKTSKMGIYFQEGKALNMSMDVLEAFRISLNTLSSWLTQNLANQETRIFFRSYSPTHYSYGAWNEGGRCDMNTSPETNHTKLDSKNTQHNIYISKAIKQIEETTKQKQKQNIQVQFLNITYLTQLRNDAHPSKHREKQQHPITLSPPQDCSHWCLPGVPDTWNELLYAYLINTTTK